MKKAYPFCNGYAFCVYKNDAVFRVADSITFSAAEQSYHRHCFRNAVVESADDKDHNRHDHHEQRTSKVLFFSAFPQKIARIKIRSRSKKLLYFA